MLEINLTQIISGAINAIINAIAVYIAIRYIGKAVDKIEKQRGEKSKNDK